MPLDPHTPRFPQVIDSTMLIGFKSCPQKFFREFIERRQIVAISPDLHAGGAFARGLEVLRSRVYGHSLPVREAIPVALHEFTKFWGDYEPPEGHNKTYVNVFNALLDYLREHPPLSDHIQPYMQSDGQPAVEFTFAIPLPINHPVSGEPILYAGRFDMLGTMGSALWIVDEKTTKAFYKGWSQQWQLRTQFLGYTWATRQLGIHTEGACVRGVAIQKTQFQHMEALVSYSEWEIDRWYAQMLRDVGRMIDCWHGEYWDYNLGEACSAYSGCPFSVLCTARRPELWYGDFIERNWNPLAKDPAAPSTDEQEKVQVYA